MSSCCGVISSMVELNSSCHWNQAEKHEMFHCSHSDFSTRQFHKKGIVFRFFALEYEAGEITPNFVAIFVFFNTASSFTERISFSEIQAKWEAILFLSSCSELNKTCIITCGLANQRTPKAVFTCVAYTNNHYYFIFHILQRCIKQQWFSACNLITEIKSEFITHLMSCY